jgi:hypothetical protein
MDVIYGLLDSLTRAADKAATCIGAERDCRGLLFLVGHAIKLAMPYAREQVDRLVGKFF